MIQAPEQPRAEGLPIILDVFRGQYVRLPFPLDGDPETTDADLSVQSSVNGTVETQSGIPQDDLRFACEGIDLDTKDKLDALWERTLRRGGDVEVYRDSTKLLHIAGDADYCLRTRRFLSGSYTKNTRGGKYGLGSIGIFHAQGGASRINFVKNGDAKDGTQHWTTTGSVELAAVQYLPQGGKDSYCFRMRASESSVGEGTIYQDMEMDAECDALGAIVISFWAWSGRHPLSGIEDVITVKVKPADGTGNTIEVGTFTPTRAPRKYYFRQVMNGTTVGTTSDHTLRLILEASGALRAAQVYLDEIQVEDNNHATGFVPRAADTSTRSADGTRADDQECRVVNPLAYVTQMPTYSEEGRLGWTIHCWFEAFWQNGSAPVSSTYIWSMGERDTNNFAAARLYINNTTGIITGAVLLDLDAGPAEVSVSSGAISVAMGDIIHTALTFWDFDGDNEDSGSIELFVNGVSVDSDTHSGRMADPGTFLFLGTDPDFDYVNAIGINDFMVDAVYIDGDDYTIEDFYDDETPPRRERTGWRCVMAPGQKGRLCKLSRDNSYNMDFRAIESRMT